MKTFNIGKMKVTIEDNVVYTSHPENAMKSNEATFEIATSLRTNQLVVVINGKGFNKYQSVSAVNRIKKEILILNGGMDK